MGLGVCEIGFLLIGVGFIIVVEVARGLGFWRG